jgi:hypothetical protein
MLVEAGIAHPLDAGDVLYRQHPGGFYRPYRDQWMSVSN